MDFEAGDGHDLEKRLPVEVNVFEVGVLLVVDVGVSEAGYRRGYPLDMIRPLDCSCSLLLELTPWIRMMSPHFSVFSC